MYVFLLQSEGMGQEKVTFSTVCESQFTQQQANTVTFYVFFVCCLKLWLISVFIAIQFVLSDEFSHLRPEQRLALLHVSAI